MIVTFTADPSIDRTAEIAALRRGVTSRARKMRVDAGGKGVNVCRALTVNGYESLAVLPVGGFEGLKLIDLLERDELRYRTIEIAMPIRVSLALVEPDGTTTTVSEPGPTLSPDELRRLAETLRSAAAGAEWAVLSGPLPTGAPATLYEELTTTLHMVGAKVALDTDSAALQAALPAAPDLVKAPRRELAAATGLAVITAADAHNAVEVLRRRGAQAVLASLGSEGAVLADATGTYEAVAGKVAVRSTAGAGDAMLAGFLAAGGAGPAALSQAVAWGTAAVTLPGAAVPSPADTDRITVTVRPTRAPGGAAGPLASSTEATA